MRKIPPTEKAAKDPVGREERGAKLTKKLKVGKEGDCRRSERERTRSGHQPPLSETIKGQAKPQRYLRLREGSTL